MIRSLRSSVVPLLLLLSLEVGAIIALQALGTSSGMQVPWSSFGNWLSTSPLEVSVPPLVRVTALAVAYWMFLSTSLFVVAQLSRIPAAIRATSMFTLPSVRRVVDGAMAVSIATTAVIGTSSNAFAAPATTEVPGPGDSISTTRGADGRITLGPATSAPSQNGEAAPTTQAPTTQVPVTTAVPTTPAPTTAAPTTQAPTTQAPTTAAPTTQAPTTQAPTTAAPTTQAPTTTAAARPTLESGDGWVATPRPGAPLENRSEAPVATPTAPPTTGAPQGGVATPAPGQTTGTSVLGASEHVVVRGDNLWTISRNALVDSGYAAPSEAQIREYWLKVIEANRNSLRSGDPHWIFPGEIVKLPPRG